MLLLLVVAEPDELIAQQSCIVGKWNWTDKAPQHGVSFELEFNANGALKFSQPWSGHYGQAGVFKSGKAVYTGRWEQAGGKFQSANVCVDASLTWEQHLKDCNNGWSDRCINFNVIEVSADGKHLVLPNGKNWATKIGPPFPCKGGSAPSSSSQVESTVQLIQQTEPTFFDEFQAAQQRAESAANVYEAEMADLRSTVDQLRNDQAASEAKTAKVVDRTAQVESADAIDYDQELNALFGGSQESVPKDDGYDALIAKADSMFQDMVDNPGTTEYRPWHPRKLYMEAMFLRPDEQYPKDMIWECDGFDSRESISKRGAAKRAKEPKESVKTVSAYDLMRASIADDSDWNSQTEIGDHEILGVPLKDQRIPIRRNGKDHFKEVEVLQDLITNKLGLHQVWSRVKKARSIIKAIQLNWDKCVFSFSSVKCDEFFEWYPLKKYKGEYKNPYGITEE